MLKNPLLEQLRGEISVEDKALIDDSFALANRIASLLKKHNISQKQLAQKLNKRESEISKWLSGGHNFTQHTLTKISLAIGEPIYMIPGSKLHIELKIEENLHILKTAFSKLFEFKKQTVLGFQNYGSNEISTLSVDAAGVICKTGSALEKENFTPATMETKDFKNIERAPF